MTLTLNIRLDDATADRLLKVVTSEKQRSIDPVHVSPHGVGRSLLIRGLEQVERELAADSKQTT